MWFRVSDSGRAPGSGRPAQVPRVVFLNLVGSVFLFAVSPFRATPAGEPVPRPTPDPLPGRDLWHERQEVLYGWSRFWSLPQGCASTIVLYPVCRHLRSQVPQRSDLPG